MITYQKQITFCNEIKTFLMINTKKNKTTDDFPSENVENDND